MVFFISILGFFVYTTERIIESVNEKLVISLYLQPWISQDHTRVVELQSELRNTFPRVGQEYISSEKALEKIRLREPQLAALVETGSENPLPNSIRITKLGIDTYERLNSVVVSYKDILQYEKTDLQNRMVTYRDQMLKIEPLVEQLQNIEYGVYAMIALFFLTVFIVLYNVIGNFVFFYSEEIKVIMLVGWSPSFIYWPFALQAGIYAFVGSTIAVIISILFFSFTNFHEYSNFVRSFVDITAPYFLMEIPLFFCIGLLSGFLSAQKYMRLIRENVHEA